MTADAFADMARLAGEREQSFRKFLSTSLYQFQRVFCRFSQNFHIFHVLKRVLVRKFGSVRVSRSHPKKGPMSKTKVPKKFKKSPMSKMSHFSVFNIHFPVQMKKWVGPYYPVGTSKPEQSRESCIVC